MRRAAYFGSVSVLLSLIVTDYAEARRGGGGFGGAGFRGGGGFGGAGFLVAASAARLPGGGFGADCVSAGDAGRQFALDGERPEVAGEPWQVGQAGVQQDCVPDGAEDGRAIDLAGDTVAAGAIVGPGTVRRVSALRARRTTAATIHMTTAMDTADMAMATTIAFRSGRASGTGTHIVGVGESLQLLLIALRGVA